jgi:energy-coupling factor transporter ATP-binding protein EcfA2
MDFGGKRRSRTEMAKLPYLAKVKSAALLITGKAGCGKSTLMKYLCQRIPLGDLGSTHDEAAGFDSAPSRCEAYLRHWAQDQELTIASFYFWSAGSEIQASRKGLYYTLLFQMLQQRPELISRISPERWSLLCVFDTDLEDFTEDDLLIMFHRTVAEICSTGKLCLFIDGLDEFHGQPYELVQLFRTIVMDNPTVKICIASRPWVVCEQAFGNKPHLMLEDLTYKVIKEYITSYFNEDSNFCLIQSQQPQQAEHLIEEILRKAEGIFLWVNIVMFSLLVGIKPGDCISDLQRRLEALEPGLQGLYDRIVDDLNPRISNKLLNTFSS